MCWFDFHIEHSGDTGWSINYTVCIDNILNMLQCINSFTCFFNFVMPFHKKFYILIIISQSISVFVMPYYITLASCAAVMPLHNSVLYVMPFYNCYQVPYSCLLIFAKIADTVMPFFTI